MTFIAYDDEAKYVYYVEIVTGVFSAFNLCFLRTHTANGGGAILHADGNSARNPVKAKM